MGPLSPLKYFHKLGTVSFLLVFDAQNTSVEASHGCGQDLTPLYFICGSDDPTLKLSQGGVESYCSVSSGYVADFLV